MTGTVTAAGDAQPAPFGASEHVLDRRRVYILPTRAGWMFVGCLATMLMGAVNYNNSLAYLLTFALTSVGLVSILYTYKNQVGLSVRVARQHPVHAGELATLELEVTNPLPYPRFGLMLRFDAGTDSALLPSSSKKEKMRPEFSGWQLIRFDVPEKDTVRLALGIATERRGWLDVGAVALSNRFPFGLFRAWSNINLDTAVMVYPAAVGDERLPAHVGDGAGEGGSAADGVEDFDGLRPYQPGDSPRRVHWKAAARTQELPVKLLSGGGGAELAFSWSEIGGSTEQRLSQLALWVTHAEQAGHRYALVLPTLRTPVASGPAHLHRCLSALAVYGLPEQAQASKP